MPVAVNPATFLKEVRTELAKVSWPTRAETVRYTMVVIGITVAVGLFVGGIDIVLTKVTELLVK